MDVGVCFLILLTMTHSEGSWSQQNYAVLYVGSSTKFYC